MTFGYVTQRYTAEFVPVLAIGALAGVTDLAGRAPSVPVRRRHVAAAAVAALALWGVTANGAMGLVNARHTWRGAPLVRLVSIQRSVSG